jgi:D-alanyl-D-alanine carboxypeptidase
MNRRIIEPLGLRDTSAPYDDPDIAGPHPHGYVKPGDTDPIDITRFNPSIAFGAGSMISSGHDVNRFLSALLAGRLLPPSELKAMMHTRSTGQDSDRAYGLGLQSMPLDCGGQYWGHDGDVMGFETVSGATGDGRQVTVMATLDPGGTDAQDTDLQKTLTTALCEAE